MAVAEQGGQFTGISWRQSRRRQEQVGKAIALLVLCAIAVLFIVPLLWMFVTSLKPLQDVFNPTWIPQPAVWANYPAALTSSPFALYFRNTLIITAVSVIGNVLSSSLVAYSFARLRYPGRELIFTLVLATLLLPGIVTLVPTYILFSKMHWVNTFLPLTVPSFLGGGAFNIFLLRQFFRGLPFELSEAARIDGAGELRIWWQIVLPLSIPILTAIAIFSFQGAWEDYLSPLIYLNTATKWTLQLGLTTFEAGGGGLPLWNYMMAASLVIMLPVLIVFFIAQRWFIESVAISGIKG
jgi:multiple sugar transport system permease protein